MVEVTSTAVSTSDMRVFSKALPLSILGLSRLHMGRISSSDQPALVFCRLQDKCETISAAALNKRLRSKERMQCVGTNRLKRCDGASAGSVDLRSDLPRLDG